MKFTLLTNILLGIILMGAIQVADMRSAAADAFYGYGGYGYAGPITSGLSTVSHAGFPLQGYAQGYGYGLWRR